MSEQFPLIKKFLGTPIAVHVSVDEKAASLDQNKNGYVEIDESTPAIWKELVNQADSFRLQPWGSGLAGSLAVFSKMGAVSALKRGGIFGAAVSLIELFLDDQQNFNSLGALANTLGTVLYDGTSTSLAITLGTVAGVFTSSFLTPVGGIVVGGVIATGAKYALDAVKDIIVESYFSSEEMKKASATAEAIREKYRLEGEISLEFLKEQLPGVDEEALNMVQDDLYPSTVEEKYPTVIGLLRENSPLFGRAKFLAKEAEQTCWSSNCEIKKSSARREFIDLNWVMVSELNDSKKKEIFAEGVALLMDDAVDPQAIPFYRSLIKNLDLFSEEEAGVLRGKLLEFVKSKGGHDSKDKDIRRLTYELVGIDPTNITVLGLGHDEDPWRQFTGLEQRKWLIKKLPEEEPTVKIEAEIASLEAMAKKYPQEPFYPFAIGFYYSDMQLNTKGDDSLADAYYKIAVALAPEVEVYLSFLSVDTDEEKRAKYEKLAQMDPTNADYYYQYQLWSNADDDRQKVYEAAQKAFELDPTNGYHWAHYLVAQVRMDLIEEAQKTAGQLDRIAPKSFADVMSFPFRSDLFPPTVRRIVLEEFIRHNPYRNTDKLQKELETIEAELAGVTTEKKAEPKAEPAPAQQSAPVAEKAQETSAPTDATDPVLQLVRKGYEQLQAGQTPASYKSFREAIKEGRRETKAKAQIGLLLAYRQGGNWGEFHKLGRDPKNDATVTSFYEQLRDRKITDQQIADMIQSRD